MDAETMYVLERNVDERGYYVRLDGGTRLVQVIHPVTFSPVVFSNLMPAPYGLTNHLIIPDAMDNLAYWVTDAQKAADENERQGPFEKLPQLPEKPVWDVVAWRRACYQMQDKRIGDMLFALMNDDNRANDDIPF